ncbi:unnamed protein product [Moneuplotes crassus]|uniref:Uncharacterized protein n=1 Tax=Euplotes crassus TaxID=5936 RepID=A0AAD1UDH8_EUPCR|nr:unnamed protein product [Moneuplotes crassus]
MVLLLGRYRELKLIQAISKIKMPVMSYIQLIEAEYRSKHFRNFDAKSTLTATETLHNLMCEECRALDILIHLSVFA